MLRYFVLIAGFVSICRLAPNASYANPYGIAGYISPSRLADLGFPEGVKTYSWDSRPEDTRYQMVCPMHYWYRWYTRGAAYVIDWASWEAQLQPETKAFYVETRQFFIDDDGKMIDKVRVKGWKRPQPLRQDDGIHFSLPCSRYFADKVAPLVLERLGL